MTGSESPKAGWRPGEGEVSPWQRGGRKKKKQDNLTRIPSRLRGRDTAAESLSGSRPSQRKSEKTNADVDDDPKQMLALSAAAKQPRFYGFLQKVAHSCGALAQEVRAPVTSGRMIRYPEPIQAGFRSERSKEIHVGPLVG